MSGKQRIGEYLVSIGAMTEQQVEAVLALQYWGEEDLFGTIALRLGVVDEEDLLRYARERVAERDSPSRRAASTRRVSAWVEKILQRTRSAA